MNECALLIQPAQADIQSVIWAKYDLSLDPGEPERYPEGYTESRVHVLPHVESWAFGAPAGIVMRAQYAGLAVSPGTAYPIAEAGYDEGVHGS
jgi:hypothetical protein